MDDAKQSQRVGGVKETAVGISEYLNSSESGNNKVLGVLKHRYRDFIVNEVGTDGKIAKITSLREKLVPEKTETNEPTADQTLTNDEIEAGVLALKEFVTDEEATNFNTMLTNYLHNKDKKLEGVTPKPLSITFQSEADKLKRKGLHETIRQHFGNFVVTDIVKKGEDPENPDICVRASIHAHTMAISKDGSRIRGGKRKGKLQVDWRSAKRMKGTREPRGFIKFVLYKENTETHFVTNRIAKMLTFSNDRKISSSMVVNIAGTKDKRGITSQFVTVNKPYSLETVEKIRRLQNKAFGRGNVVFGGFEKVTECLKLGDLNGNQFTITIRKLTLTGSKEDNNQKIRDLLAERLKNIREDGFINYFGLQRFGVRAKNPTYLFGLFLISQNYSKLLTAFFSPSSEDNENINAAKAKVREVLGHTSVELSDSQVTMHFGKDNTTLLKNMREALRSMPGFMTAEKSLIKTLMKKSEKLASGDHISVSVSLVDAVKGIPYHLRNLYLHSFQSLIFNKAASLRLQKYSASVVEGDLVMSKLQPGTVEIVSATNIKEYSIFDVVLPLPGFDIRYPTNNINKEVYDQLILKELEKTGCTGSDTTFGNVFEKAPRNVSVPGSYRKVITAVPDLTFKFIEYDYEDKDLYKTQVDLLRLQETNVIPNIAPIKENNEEKKGLALQMSFTLPQSCYATMLFRELMRVETDLESLKEQSK